MATVRRLRYIAESNVMPADKHARERVGGSTTRATPSESSRTTGGNVCCADTNGSSRRVRGRTVDRSDSADYDIAQQASGGFRKSVTAASTLERSELPSAALATRTRSSAKAKVRSNDTRGLLFTVPIFRWHVRHRESAKIFPTMKRQEVCVVIIP